MNKVYASKRNVQLIFASLVCGSCFFSPEQVLAGRRLFTEKGNVLMYQTITGTVKDAATGESLSGATIGIKGVARTTTSDVNGSFRLEAPDNSQVLVVSFVGYVTQEIVIAGKTQIEIRLQAAATDLSQVVVVGYGTQRKKDVTGAVKSLRSEDFNKGIVNSPQQLLQGKMAGVNIVSASGEPGAVQGITVRGPGGVRTGSTPLFVVDGVPLDNSSTGGGDPLNFLNPNDIESIDALKDASATAIYGSRGANGVIIITTKKGRAGQATLNFNTSLGLSKLANKLPVFSADEFRKQVPAVGGTLDDKGGNTDWQDEVTRTGVAQVYNLSLSGGADKLTYYASFGMQKQQGIIKNNDQNLYSGRFNATQRFWDDALTIEANLGVSNTKNERPPVSNIIGEMLTNNPTYPSRTADGSVARYTVFNNPLLYFELDNELTVINRVTGNLSPSLRIVKGLVYKLNFGIDNSNSQRDVISRPSAEPQRDGRLETYDISNKNTLIENYLTYTLDKDKHNLSVMAGFSYQKFLQQGRNTSVNKFPIGQVDPYYNPGYGQELTFALNRPGGYAFENELQSYYGRINYQFNEKYLLTASFRADGSSKFGENNKYGYFPSFSLGWKISEEEFMKGGPFSNLKLRGGWGITGNQEIPPKFSRELYSSYATAGFSYPLAPNGTYPAGTVYTRLPNPDLQWETSNQTNVGLDFGLLNGDLTGAIDVFRKVSSNVLLKLQPPDPVQPVGDYYANVKDMNIINKGLELDINYRHNTSSGWTYSIGGNVTFMDNEVRNSPYSLIPSGSASGSGLTSATINGYINGQPVGTFYLLNWTGFDANGISTYADTDKDGIVGDKDRISAGTALPKVMYSFSGSIAYKRFDLGVNFNGVSGNKVYDNTANANFYKLKLSKNVNVTPEAIEDSRESVNNAASVSTRYLKDGAFLRLNNATLAYTFDTKAIGLSRYISGLRLSATGQNLFVITKYTGFDPEVNTDRSIDGVSSFGIDYLSYPKARSFVVSLNVSF